MPWRTLEVGGQEYAVTMAAERRAQSDRWNLVLSFRPTSGERRTLWATYPLTADSRSMLFAQADQIPDQSLAALLAEQLG